jgi:hypothetical protein
MVIKRIGVLKLAVFQACMGVALGVCVALLFMGFGSMLAGLGGQHAAGAGLIGLFGGIAMLIFLPVIYGVIGFIGGAVVAALYNLVAALVGGIEIDVE